MSRKTISIITIIIGVSIIWFMTLRWQKPNAGDYTNQIIELKWTLGRISAARLKNKKVAPISGMDDFFIFKALLPEFASGTKI